MARLFRPPPPNPLELKNPQHQLLPFRHQDNGGYIVSNAQIVHTSDASFDTDVLKSERPVLLDFWAEWCGPCKMIAPILDEIAVEYKDKLRVAKIDIESNPQTPPKFGIRNIPTLILFKNGTVEAQKVGSVRKPDLKSFLDAHL